MGGRGGWAHLQLQAQLVQQLQRMHGDCFSCAFYRQGGKVLKRSLGFWRWNTLSAFILVASQAHLPYAYSCRQANKAAAWLLISL